MEQLFLVLSMTLSAAIMFLSIKVILRHPVIKDRVIPFSNLLALFFIYITIITGFGLMYLSLTILGLPVLTESNQLLNNTFLEMLQSTIYFSAVTLLSVGYGDITPVGLGRWVATFEALIGYILPAIFVLSSFTDNRFD
jgi:potassium channel LctB